MWYTGVTILRSLVGLIGAVVMLGSFFMAYPKLAWIGYGVVPVCFLPAAVLAAWLAQRLDVEKKAALWIGLPTIVAMTLVTLFSFFMFSKSGERVFGSVPLALGAVVMLAAMVALLYFFALRLAFPEGFAMGKRADKAPKPAPLRGVTPL